MSVGRTREEVEEGGSLRCLRYVKWSREQVAVRREWNGGGGGRNENGRRIKEGGGRIPLKQFLLS